MDEHGRTSSHCFGLAIALFILAVSPAWAVSTAFTYQGKLTDAGSPANGNYDMQFKLFDTPTVGTGAQHGSPLVNQRTGVMASAGVFTVTLDFGNPFSVDLYLEIGVRPGGSGGAYTPLGARQPVTASPYAIETLNSQQLGGLPAARYVATDAAGNVGIGTASPQQTLQVNGVTSLGPPGSVYAYMVNGPSPGPYPTIGFNTHGQYYFAGVQGFGSVLQYQVGDGSLTYSTGTLNSAGEPHDFNPRFTILQNGAVGIGTVTPSQARLNVRSGGAEIAVYGENTSNGAGVVGGSSSGVGVYAGSSTGDGMYSTSTSGNGLSATSTYSYGVHGIGTNFVGVFGEGADSGVRGASPSGKGIRGTSTSGTGVYGESSAASLTAGGVYGKGLATGSIGVIGESNIGYGVGVYGASTSSIGSGMYARNLNGGRALYAEGHAGQSREHGGMVKAMAVIGKGVIKRCFNSYTNSTTGNCGFPVLLYNSSTDVTTINFGFQIDDRFIALTAIYPLSGLAISRRLEIVALTGSAISIYSLASDCTGGGFCGIEGMDFSIVIF